jgi:membrane protease YdiL (CAAX protease family)
LFEQLIGFSRSMGLSITAAIFLTLLVGELLAVGIALLYLRWSARPLRAFLPVGRLRWWEVTLVPLGLLVSAQILAQGGVALLTALFHLAPAVGKATAAIIPHQPVEFILAVAASVLAAGFCEEFLFRAFLPAVLGEYLPQWLAAALSMPLFALIHLMGFGWMSLVSYTLWAIPYTLYVRRSQKLLPAMVAHALNDLLIFTVFLPLLVRAG